jgi:hypothetical protein
MSNIVELDSFRKKKESIKKQNQKSTKAYQAGVYQQALDAVLADWEYAINNKIINEYLKKKIGLNYPNFFSLDTASEIEQEFKIVVAMFYPGALTHNPFGYIAGFNIGELAFATPEMNDEITARLLNILLFLEMSQLQKQGVL